MLLRVAVRRLLPNQLDLFRPSTCSAAVTFAAAFEDLDSAFENFATARPSTKKLHTTSQFWPAFNVPGCRSIHTGVVSAEAGSGSTSALLSPDSLMGFLASSPLEAFTTMPPPTQLSIQMWEVVHLGVGVPWWVSIPLTTLLLRSLLLPFTLKAKAATVNFTLWGHAFSQASLALAHSNQSGPASMRERVRAASLVYRYMRTKHRTPGTFWYIGNSLLQVPTFLLLSVGLRRMCEVQWPGLNGEGLLFITDLTAPSVVAATWATPYGPFGLFLPLAIFATYAASLKYCAAARTPAVATALEAVSLPYLCAAMLTPQAVQLYWLSNSAFHMGLQALLSKPQVAKRLGLPMLLVQPQNETDAQEKRDMEAAEVQQLVDASSDVELLMLLAHDQMAAGRPAAAAATFQKVLTLRPGHLPTMTGAALAHAKAQDWQVAAQLYQQAAEAASSTKEQAQLYGMAAMNYLEAAAGQGPWPATQDSTLTGSGESSTENASSDSGHDNQATLLSQAHAAADRAVGLQPYSPSSHLCKAYAQLLAGSPIDACDSITQSLQLALQGTANSSVSASAGSSSPAADTSQQPAGAVSSDASAAMNSEAHNTSSGGSVPPVSEEALRLLSDVVALADRVLVRLDSEQKERQEHLAGMLQTASDRLGGR